MRRNGIAAKVKKAVTESTELWLEVADIDDQASIAPIVTQYGLDLEKTLSSKLNAAQKEEAGQSRSHLRLPSGES